MTPVILDSRHPKLRLGSSPNSGGRDSAWVTLGLTVSLAIAFHRILFLGETFVLRDHLIHAVAFFQFLRDGLVSGRFPEWADYYGLGLPFAANPDHGVMYPPAWLAAALPMPLGMDLFAVGHLLLAAVGAAFLSARWGAPRLGAFLAGLLFAMSGAVGSVVGNGTVPSIAWIPWVAWAADRLANSGEGLASYESRRAQVRDALIFAALLAPELVRGEPAGILTSALAAFAVTIARAPRRAPALGRLSLAAAGSVALAAATVLPALYLLPFSDRAEGTGAIGLAWSMHPARIVEWVWPCMFGDPAWRSRNISSLVANTNVVPRGATNWSASVFFGAPALWLAARARGRGARTLLLASLAFVVLALGRFTPMYPALREISFPLQLVRFPEKFLMGAVCIWSALAGAGLGATFSERPSLRAIVGATAVAVALTLLVTAGAIAAPHLVAHLAAAAAATQPPTDIDAALMTSIREGAIAAGVATAFAIIVAWRRLRATALSASLAVVFLLSAHLLWHAIAYTPTAPREIVERRPTLLEGIEPLASGIRPRLFCGDTGVVPTLVNGAEYAEFVHESVQLNVAGRFGLAALPSRGSATSAAWQRFWAAAVNRMSMRCLASVFDVEHMVMQRSAASAAVLPVLATTPSGWALAATTSVRPRAFVASRWTFADEEGAISDLVDPGRVDFERVTLIGEGPAAPDADDRLRERLTPCVIRSPIPERVELTCDSRLGGWAVLLDQAAPGWQATVDGVASPIATADALFRAVRVEAGRHEVIFTYRTPGLRLGTGVAVASWALWLALLVGVWVARSA